LGSQHGKKEKNFTAQSTNKVGEDMDGAQQNRKIEKKSQGS